MIRYRKSDYKISGFTFIELLVVISVITVLSTVILININRARDLSRNSEIVTATGQWIRALNMHFNEKGGYYPFASMPQAPICLGLPNVCAPWSPPINNGFISAMDPYLSSTPNPNKDAITYGNIFIKYRATYTTECLNGLCKRATVYFYLYGDQDCPYGAVKSYNINTQCTLELK